MIDRKAFVIQQPMTTVLNACVCGGLQFLFSCVSNIHIRNGLEQNLLFGTRFPAQMFPLVLQKEKQSKNRKTRVTAMEIQWLAACVQQCLEQTPSAASFMESKLAGEVWKVLFVSISILNFLKNGHGCFQVTHSACSPKPGASSVFFLSSPKANSSVSVGNSRYVSDLNKEYNVNLLD